jgi:methionyl-tRNA formyltransferase
MRIVFAGTPEFAATALAALIEAAPVHRWTIPLVLSQPDRPAGRGMRLAASPVKTLAQRHALPVATPRTLSLARGGEEAAAAHAQVSSAAPDVLVVAAYGLILPRAVLEIPRGLADAGGGPLTAINIHASLLPRWRGAAPVARAIEAGDTTTGITLMQMDAGLDTGPMLMAEALPIDARDTTGSLTTKLAALGAGMIVAALEAAVRRAVRAVPQPEHGATYAHKVDKHEAWLDWTMPAEMLARRVRAFDPFPGASTLAGDTVIKLWRAHAVPASSGAAPGTIIAATADGVRIACGGGELCVTELQRPGGRRLPVREFLAGTALREGEACRRAPDGASPRPGR